MRDPISGLMIFAFLGFGLFGIIAPRTCYQLSKDLQFRVIDFYAAIGLVTPRQKREGTVFLYLEPTELHLVFVRLGGVFAIVMAILMMMGVL